MSDEKLLTTDQAAEYLSVSPATLKAWRMRGDGPPCVRLRTKMVRYRMTDLDAWLVPLRNPAEAEEVPS